MTEWSTKKIGKYKEYKYIEKSLFRRKEEEKSIWCRNEEAFYRFLNYMNSNYRHFKFFAYYMNDEFGPLNDELMKRYNEASHILRRLDRENVINGDQI